MGIWALLSAYLLGGVTFIPLVVFLFVYSHPKIAVDGDDEDSQNLKAGEVEEKEDSGIGAFKSGWITVTQEYLESTDDITTATQSINDSHDNKSAYSSLYRLVKNSDNGKESPEIDPSGSQSPSSAQSPEKVKGYQKKHRFYGILKHGNLFLYKNSSLKDVKHVIVLANQVISLWPRNISDGSLFTKRTAICMIKKDWTRTRRLSENFGNEKLTVEDILNPANDLQPPKSSFFIHCDTNIDKEDWYFALVRASKVSTDVSGLSSNLHAKTLHFDTKDIMDLIQTLYSTEGQLSTKWMNALFGRLFLALQKTEVLDDFLKDRISKKLNKIKTPGFLEKFKLGAVKSGSSAPFFTYPTLKEINPNGTLVFTAYVHYHGGMSCNISTKMSINIGAGFKPREVDVSLAVTLQKLEGPMIFKIKPPPSERIWYAFEIEPIMNLKIEPIISSRQITYNLVTKSIENKFKEAVKESLVVPHFDDLVFYNTQDETYRGGIWDKTSRDGSDYNESETESLVPSVSNSSNKSPPESISSASNFRPMELKSTLSGLSKRLKKSKSSHTVSVNGDSCLSDGSILEKENESDDQRNGDADSGLSKTLRKIGNWYTNAREEKPKPEDPVYHPPEMISNRRKPRQSVSEPRSPIVSTGMSSPSPSYEMFTKPGDGYGQPTHTRKDSRFSTSSTETSLASHLRDDTSTNSERLESPIREEHIEALKNDPIVGVSKTTAQVTTESSSPSLERHDTKLHRKPPPLSFKELDLLEKSSVAPSPQTAEAVSDLDYSNQIKRDIEEAIKIKEEKPFEGEDPHVFENGPPLASHESLDVTKLKEFS